MKSSNGSERDHLHAEPAPAGGFLREIAVELRVSIMAVVVLAVIVCGIYPAVVWGLSQAFFRHQADGSLIGKDGQPVSDEKQAVGSALIGQGFADAKYFHPRPSSAGNGYDPTASGGSNLGPTSAKLINGTTKKDDKGNEVVDFDGVHDRIVHYCVENNIPFESSVPLKQFQDAQGNLDDVKLIKAF
ncbi:MAG TPA: potassium-transporting ATPase subunit C, partial [Tepidisphaeraceae bacterium]